MPVNSGGASVASHTAVSAPSSTDRGAVGPPISVRTQPGHMEFTAILSPCRVLASMRVTPLSASFESGVDADSLAKLKELSADSGVPYQRLLNSILKERLAKVDTFHSRLDRLEKELARVKKTLAA